MVNAWNTGDLTLEHLFSANSIEKSFTPFHKTAAEGNTPSSPGPQPQPGTQSQGIPWLSYCDDILGLSPHENVGSLDLGIQNNDTIDRTHNYMEELSRINLDLVTQLRQMREGPPHVNLKSIIAPDYGKSGPSATPLEDLLNSTRLYLDVLSFVAGSPRSSPSSASNAMRIPGSYSDYASTSARTSVSQDDTSQSSDSSPASTEPSNIGVSRTQPDTATLLLVLICYVHILRLHVALFAHIQQYLQGKRL